MTRSYLRWDAATQRVVEVQIPPTLSESLSLWMRRNKSAQAIVEKPTAKLDGIGRFQIAPAEVIGGARQQGLIGGADLGQEPRNDNHPNKLHLLETFVDHDGAAAQDDPSGEKHDQDVQHSAPSQRLIQAQVATHGYALIFGRPFWPDMHWPRFSSSICWGGYHELSQAHPVYAR